MCGIAGVVAFDERGKASLDRLEAATDRLRSRGPDHRDTFYHEGVGLGHRRLVIIDPSPGANQPMSCESGRYTIVYNGEIYNFRSLKRELEARGVTFDTESDTEVVLKFFAAEGPSFLRRLNGFFAFAIYDRADGSLFVARDRLGIKPLYFYQDGHHFIFASEMKSLAEFSFPRELDNVSLYQYLQLNYIPAPYSIFENVRKLEPGKYLRVKDGQVSEASYYEVPFEKGVSTNGSYREVQAKLVETLEASVCSRLVSDVPLGAFLSGGIDSSIIVALAARHVDRLDTFCIGFRDNPLYDESKYAQLVADHCGTRHTTFPLTSGELYECLSGVLEYTDEPFADPSALAVYILSRCTREHVKVALSGDGADELFGGYNKHLGDFRVRRGGPAAFMVKRSAPLLAMVRWSRDSVWGNKLRQLHRFARGARLSARERYWSWCSFTEADEVLALLAPSRKRFGRLQEEEAFDERREAVLAGIGEDGDLNDVLYADTQLVLHNNMLRKVDGMSMAHGLEVRVPFLDHHVVGMAFTLPPEYKIGGGMTKRILRDAFRSQLPPALYRRSKHGFDVPLMKWFRTELRSMICDDLLDDDFVEAQGIFDVGAVRDVKRRLFGRRPGDIEREVWSLIVFQSWWQRYMAV